MATIVNTLSYQIQDYNTKTKLSKLTEDLSSEVQNMNKKVHSLHNTILLMKQLNLDELSLSIPDKMKSFLLMQADNAVFPSVNRIE